MTHAFEASLFWSGDERTCAEAWKAALDTDAPAAIARMRAIESGLDWSSIRSAFDGARTRCRESLDGLSCSLDRALTAFPEPTGVFVRAEERARAYRLICRLLSDTEPIKQRLADGARMLLSVGGLFLETERAILAARWELEILEALAHPAAEREVATLRMRADAAWMTHTQEKTVWREQSDAVMRFSDVTLADFARQVSKNADFSHEGEICNPGALKRDCAELKTLCERLAQLLQKDK